MMDAQYERTAEVALDAIDTMFVDVNFIRIYNGHNHIKEVGVAGRTTAGNYFHQSYMIRRRFDSNEENIELYNPEQNDMHGIDWNEGKTPLKSVGVVFERLNESSLVVFKSKRKEALMKHFFTHFDCKTTVDFPSVITENWVKRITPKPLFCSFHAFKPNKTCALTNARLMCIQFAAQRHLKKSNYFPSPRKDMAISAVKAEVVADVAADVAVERMFVDINFMYNDTGLHFLKELAVVGQTTAGTAFHECYIFQNPKSERGFIFPPLCIAAAFHIHGITIKDGDVPFNNLRIFDMLTESSVVIFRTRQKKEITEIFYKQQLSRATTLDMETSGIRCWVEDLSPEPMLCAFHAFKPGKSCALNNARLMSLSCLSQRALKLGIFKKK